MERTGTAASFYKQWQDFSYSNTINPKEFYKQFYLALLQDLWNTGSSDILLYRRQELLACRGQNDMHATKHVFRINYIEWQVYQDLYKKCIENNDKLPLLDDNVLIPKRVVVGENHIEWRELDGYMQEDECPQRIMGTIMETIVNLLRIGSKYAPGVRTKSEKRSIPIQTKEDIVFQGEKNQSESRSSRISTDKEESIHLLEQAKKDAEKIRKDAEDDAAKISEKAEKESEQKAQEIAHDLIRKYISSEVSSNWLNLRQAIESEDTARQEDLTRGEREREEIWARVSAMQGDLVKSFEDMVTEITKVKLDLCQELGDWRSSLHVNQFDDMTKVYTGLFRLHDEMNRTLSIAVTSELPDESKVELTDGIDRMLGHLSVLERQMDRALGVFGMYCVRPEKGDLFDFESHELTDKQQDEGITDGEGYRIMRCVTPGVALHYNETLREDRILRKAKVEVDPESKN